MPETMTLQIRDFYVADGDILATFRAENGRDALALYSISQGFADPRDSDDEYSWFHEDHLLGVWTMTFTNTTLVAEHAVETQSLTPPDDQARAIEAEAYGGPQHARTKAEVKIEAEILSEALDLRVSGVIVTTWLGASGDSFDLHLDSQADGPRVRVHRWHATGETAITAVTGSFWRPKQGREGVRWGRLVLPADISDVHVIAEAVHAMVLALAVRSAS